MFPFGPQPPRTPRPPRPIPPNHPFMSPPNQIHHQQQNVNKPGIMSMFQTQEGNLDFEKITGTVSQINKLYGQFSPMISKFLNR